MERTTIKLYVNSKQLYVKFNKKGQVAITVEKEMNSNLLNKPSVANYRKKRLFRMNLFSHFKVTTLTHSRQILGFYAHFINNKTLFTLLYYNYNTLIKWLHEIYHIYLSLCLIVRNMNTILSKVALYMYSIISCIIFLKWSVLQK